MNNKEAMKALIDGKCIRRINWTAPRRYHFLDEKGCIMESDLDRNSTTPMTLNHFNSSNTMPWEIYIHEKDRRLVPSIEIRVNLHKNNIITNKNGTCLGSVLFSEGFNFDVLRASVIKEH